jgi:Uma2 family endonuclease
VDRAERIETEWTAEAFLETDQRAFGSAWRYELVDGQIIAHAAPAPDHGAIIAGLTAALVSRLRGHPDRCRPEAGSGAVPKRKQRNTACIPDVMIRCRGGNPRVTFEVLSPSDLKNPRAFDRKRKDLQDVEGVQEIIEIYQTETLIHAYRRDPKGEWVFESLREITDTLNLPSVGISVPLAEIYEFTTPAYDE